MITVHLFVVPRDFRPDDPRHDPVRHLDYGRISPQLSGRCRNFKADQAATDNDDPATRLDLLLQAQTIFHAAQVEQRRCLGTRQVESARPGAGRQDEPVIGNGSTIGQFELVLCPVDRIDLVEPTC